MQRSYLYLHKNGIALSKIEAGDLALLMDHLNTTWYGRHSWAAVNMLNQQDWFEKVSRDATQFIVMAFDNGTSLKEKCDPLTPVGLYKLRNIDLINRCADSAHDVFKIAQGLGYGHLVLQAGIDAAFEMFGLNRLNTEVLANNIASQKTAIKAGYTEEGVKRKAILKCGERIDSICYGLLYEDWKKLDRVLCFKGCSNKSYVPKERK